MIDLHTHSNASDGSLSPSALVALAAERGLSALALTDHDTVNGLTEAEAAAKANGIRFIRGIELEISMPEEVSGEFHLLGLNLGSLTPAFTRAVAELAAGREARNLEILDRMEELGVEASYDELRALSGGHSIGRPHFAALLVKRKIVRNVEQAFKRYLARGRPFYVPRAGIDFDQAVSAIHESGGFAVLAHPLSLYIGWGRLPALVKTLKDRSLDGLEAWHPSSKPGECKRLEELAASLDLFRTAGSDFHGEARPDRKLGITAGGRKIDDSLLDAAFSTAWCIDLPPVKWTRS